jgi:hypothetical protein
VRQGSLILAGPLLLVLLSGCGSRARSEPVARLEGNVTIGGKPLPADAEGSVIFMPAARGEAPPVQAAIKGGRYRAEKVPVGQVLATFHIARPTGKLLRDSPSDPHPTPERIDLVPPASGGGVKIEVRGDNPHQDFDLK